METLPVSTPAGGRRTPAVVLTIAGFDPSSGAGITADLKVFAAHRMYGIAATTALTVQSTRFVKRVEPVDAELLAETLACLAEDLPVAGVKVGMLGTAANVSLVARFLAGLRAQQNPALPIVLDPVLCSSSGHPLLEPVGVAALQAELLPLVTAVTPNTAELLLLAGYSQQGQASNLEPTLARQATIEAAGLLQKLYSGLAIVATGGHLEPPDDCVFLPTQEPLWLAGERVLTQATHGTGCAFSSALLCGLVQGLSVQQAAQAAKRYVTAALRAATPMGAGGGSMHHLYAAFGEESGVQAVASSQPLTAGE